MVEGFKNTEVGVIPSDWELCTLGEIGSFKNGINKGKEDFGHGSPFVNLLDVFGKNYIDSSIELGLINSNDFERQLYSLKKGDVIFVRSSVKPSGVGLTILCKEDLPNAVFSGFLIRFRDNGKIDLDFKIHCFYEEGFRKRLISNSTVSANTNINQVALKALLIPLPPTKTEQTAIATALNDADALIQKLEQLIAKKRNIKTGAMQELLKPKEGWEEKYLTEYVDYIHGKAHEQHIDRNGKYVVVNSKFISSDGTVLKHSNQNYCPAKEGDILTVLSDLPNGKALAKCFYVNADKKYAVNQRICIWRSKGAVPKFLFYILNRNKYFIGLDDGISQTHILNHHIEKCRISIPNNRIEQTRIAQILSDMDNEIQELETQLEKYKMMKQGMMQSLLTGKIRLV